MWTRIRQRLLGLWITLSRRASADVGADEFGIALALAVLTIGLWPRIGRDALIVDGAILVWMFLPTRAPFVVGPERKKD